MADETPFDEEDHALRQLVVVQEHAEVEVKQLQRGGKCNNNNNTKTYYLGTRMDRRGNWIRRHCSEKRYPRMAGKFSVSSPSPSHIDEETDDSELGRCENKVAPKGRLPSSPRRQRQLQQKQQQQQQPQLSSRQSDHSQQLVHVECEIRTDPEETSHNIRNELVHHKKYINKSAQGNKPILLNNPIQSQTKETNQCIQQSERVASNFESSSNSCGRRHASSKMSDNEKRHTRQKKHKLIFDASSFQSNKNSAKLVGDEISGLFTANSKMTSSTRQHSLESENSGDEERIRRFSDAYAAIMSAHQVKPAVPRPSYSGKRWTRDPNIVSALSIDGRSYIDLQRTPTLSLKQMLTSPDVYDSNRGMLNVELHDRKASWLVHLPRTSLK